MTDKSRCFHCMGCDRRNYICLLIGLESLFYLVCCFSDLSHYLFIKIIFQIWHLVYKLNKCVSLCLLLIFDSITVLYLHFFLTQMRLGLSHAYSKQLSLSPRMTLFVSIAVHFWAPTFKWGISIANIADFSKPPENLSYPQQIGMWYIKQSYVCTSLHQLSIQVYLVR